MLKNQGKHNLTSDFTETGDTSALTQPQRARWVELRAQIAEPDGRIDALTDKAASLALIVEWGQEWLRDRAEHEGAVKAFESPMLARWFTAFESFRRVIESLHRMQGKPDGLTAADVLDAVKGGGHEQDQ